MYQIIKICRHLQLLRADRGPRLGHCCFHPKKNMVSPTEMEGSQGKKKQKHDDKFQEWKFQQV